MKKYFWNHHAWRSQNPKITKIGDRYIVDISETLTFSDSLDLVGSNFENHLLVLLSGIHPSRTITLAGPQCAARVN